MLTILTGTGRLPQAQTRRMALRAVNENPIEFAPDSTRTTRIETRSQPIERVQYLLRGDLVVTVGATLIAGGAMNLIKRFAVNRNGNTPIYTLNGPALQIIDRIYNRHNAKPLSTDPAVGVATNPFLYLFTHPIDIGGYVSLLDASGDTSLNVSADFGNVSDVISAGTATLANVTVTPVPYIVDGALIGEVGSIGQPYFRHVVTTESKPVTKAEDDFRLDLTPGRGYIGLTLFAYKDGVLADDVIEAITLERDNDINTGKQAADVVRGQNVEDFNLAAASDWTGIYHVPFTKPNHLEHTLSINTSQSMRLILKVAHPGTVDHVELVEHYLRGAQ